MPPDKPSTAPASTIRGDEAARFDRLAATWWNSEGPMRPLHVINALRLGYVLEQIVRCFQGPVGDLRGLRIDYRIGSDRIGEPEAALRDGESFDVLLLLEVVEHVDNVQGFVREAARRLKPGGLLLASTISRTARSFATAIVGVEYVFRVLPRGTHHWAQFVRPDELEQAAQAGGLKRHDCRGMRYVPVVHRAWWTRDLSVNYVASFTRGAVDNGSKA